MSRTDPDAWPTRDALDEIAVLRRELERERARRAAAERIGERATTELYETVEELRSVQAEILETADRNNVVHELVRELRQDLDSARLLKRAVRALGTATRADRCQVHVVAGGPDRTSYAAWVAEHLDLPGAVAFPELPESFTRLLRVGERDQRPVTVDDVEHDLRLTESAASELVAALGVRGLVAAPMRVGIHPVGWLFVESVEPRAWQEREIALCNGLAHELGTVLLQVQAYEQQRESVRRLTEVDRAKDAFISHVSHELRTPLTSISGYLELILDGALGDLPPDLTRAVGVINRNAGRLRSLVEDLLTLSAYDADALQHDRHPLDLGVVVADAHHSLLLQLAHRNLDVRLDISPGLHQVDADREQVARAVHNVLTNAVKFTPDGGSIRITVDNVARGVVLSVADTGIGIPDDEQPRVFTRFFRSSLSVRAEIQGAGLGLALARTIVEQHGGTIDLVSAEGEGTTVTMVLPADDA
jgi:two-component system phosphate regulon sensor histidine kinase PhoR